MGELEKIKLRLDKIMEVLHEKGLVKECDNCNGTGNQFYDMIGRYGTCSCCDGATFTIKEN